MSNVAYDHVGHCYFLEDGGEKHTLFRDNLGIGTKVGTLTPSDERPTTFWITSPLTTLVGNSAAGSDFVWGVGYWYLFPDRPVGESRTERFFGFREAKRTPIGSFKVKYSRHDTKPTLGQQKVGSVHCKVGRG